MQKPFRIKMRRPMQNYVVDAIKDDNNSTLKTSSDSDVRGY